MESRKGKTREVTRNTCNTTEHHLQELIVTRLVVKFDGRTLLFVLKDKLAKQRHSESHILLLLPQGLEATSSDCIFQVAIKREAKRLPVYKEQLSITAALRSPSNPKTSNKNEYKLPQSTALYVFMVTKKKEKPEN